MLKTALVLSGGAARGIAHLGVLRHLDGETFPVHMILGTSMGAIIGALYAHHGSVAIVEEKIHTFVHSAIFRETLSLAVDENSALPSASSLFDRFAQQLRKSYLYTRLVTRSSLIPEDDYWKLLTGLVPDIRIEDLPTPFGAVTLDILTGDEVVLTSGSLIKALGASASIPGMGPPVRYRGRLLVDGGWIDNVPCLPARRLGAHFVLAVDTSSEVADMHPLPSCALEYALRSSEASRMALNKLRLQHADTVVRPHVSHIRWSDFHLFEQILQAGHEAWVAAASFIKKTYRSYRINPLRRLRAALRARFLPYGLPLVFV
ncbi:patatin-like phospholipase family protein [Desulfosoma caldarium]|uniref:NTE family protein n=1 Tax=Desulfosoma caldarium TaxID=610254 RepID=A0A3N1ULK0_9BACT|nr:patatin-like phospholipase family protein [Desulfosoma caldarium]ROQ92112.1 NTE family protein [Desulfosoma caldarium]